MTWQPIDDTLGGERRACAVRRVLAAGMLLLFGATHPLWIRQTEFPRVPWLSWGARCPAVVEWVSTVLALAALLMVSLAASRPRVWRPALAIFVCGLGGSIFFDQQRLQPWAYQGLLLAIALAACPTARGLILARWLTIGIYFWSGVSKLDYDFLHGFGQRLLDAALAFVGSSTENWGPGGRVAAACIFPLVELAIAAGLSARRTRQVACVSSVVLHGVLILLLGPWALGHSLGVLCWNGFFIVQNVLLFGERPVTARPGPERAGNERAAAANFAPHAVADRWHPAAIAAQSIVGLALLLPAVEPWGWFDAWPSWALYAPSCERIVISVHRRALDRLGSLAVFAVDAADDSAWVRFRLDRWSLAAVAAPLYPQNRFQLGVAESVAASCHLGPWIRVVVWGHADRLSGQRQSRELIGADQISAAGGEYWLNNAPDGLFAPTANEAE